MVTFRCGKCAQPLKAVDAAVGKAVKCPRCGHINVCPPPAATPMTGRPVGQPTGAEEPPPDKSRLIWIAAGVLLLAGASWMAWTTLDTSSASAETANLSPADALQQELLHQDIDKPGDPGLGAMAETISTQYFGGAVPSMPVMWEPGLARVGPLAGQGFTLEGMFGHIGRQAVILLNPALQTDQAALDRALCHEMVHAFLWSRGDNSTDHGESFQTVLASLSKAGAFEGVVATEQERASLRAWLDAESKRLDEEGKALAALGPDLEQEKANVERALADYDARVRNASGGNLPSQAEMDAVMKLREEYNKRAAAANERTAQGRKDLEHFNEEVARYNLMLVYPDGIDESARVSPKAAPGRGQ
ncbi:MAG TPA: SprT-like domain-containing protein [Vicinamibacterales bacterium]|nr:SprT-like domain-containing protein [Vicinamibacterales bacterium]